MSILSQRAASIAFGMAATAALTVLAASPASATAPGGSAKKVTTTVSDAGICDVQGGLLYTATYVDIQQNRSTGTATPGSIVETWTNPRTGAWLKVQNAGSAVVSDSTVGTTETIHLLISGLGNLVTTSDGGMERSLTFAGRLDETVVLDVSGEEAVLISDTSSFTGKSSTGDFCAVADATLG